MTSAEKDTLIGGLAVVAIVLMAIGWGAVL